MDRIPVVPWKWESTARIHQWSGNSVSTLPRRLGIWAAVSELYMCTVRFVLHRDWNVIVRLKAALQGAHETWAGICIKTQDQIYYLPSSRLTHNADIEYRHRYDALCATFDSTELTPCPIGNLVQVGIYVHSTIAPLPQLDPASVFVQFNWNLFALDGQLPTGMGLTHRLAPGAIFTGPGGAQVLFKGRTLEDLYVVEDRTGRTIVAPAETFLPVHTITSIPRESLASTRASDIRRTGAEFNLVEYLVKKLWSQTVQGVPIMEILLALTDRDGLWFPVYITGGSIRDYLLGKEPNDIDLVVGGSYGDVRNRIQTFFAMLGKPLTEETLRTDKLTKSFGQMKVMNVNGEPEPLDIALFKCGKYDYKTTFGVTSESNYSFGYSCTEDMKYRDYSFNALYLDLFNNILYGHTEAINDARNLLLRVVNPREFVTNDLGGQLRLWKMLKGDSNLRPVETDFPVRTYVADLLYKKIDSIANPATNTDEGVEFFVKLRKKLFKDMISVPQTAIDWHAYFAVLIPELAPSTPPKWWWRMMDFIEGKAPFNAFPAVLTKAKTILSLLPLDVTIMVAMLMKSRPLPGHARRGLGDAGEGRGIEGDRDIGGDRDIEGDRDIGSEREIAAATGDLQRVLNVYNQISGSTELQALRTEQRGLFDSLLQHAVPFALQAASSALNAIKASQSGKRDIGQDVAIEQHLPTAINFAQQVNALPEVKENRGLFSKIFSIGMPLVLNTAQTLLGAKRSLDATSGDRGFFDAIIGGLPSTVFSVLSNGFGGKRELGGDRDLNEQGRDLGEDRGFFDVLKKLAPIVLNVASTAANSLGGQRSLTSAPTDRGFFSKLKNIVSKVVSNPMVQKIGGAALRLGVQVAGNTPFGSVLGVASNLLGGQRAIDGQLPTIEHAEATARGFFGTMLQHLTPIAMNALKGALSGAAGAIAKRDVGAVPEERGIFDIVAKYLPAVVQVSQEAFFKKRAIGSTSEDEVQFLQRVISTAAPSIIQAATASKDGERALSDVVTSYVA